MTTHTSGLARLRFFEGTRLTALGVFAAATLGCSDTDRVLLAPASAASPTGAGSASNGTGDSPTGTALPPGDATPAQTANPLYVVSTGIVSGDDFLGYLTTVPSVDTGTTFNLDRAVEVGAGACIFNRPGDASVYVASLTDATIVRWECAGTATSYAMKRSTSANSGRAAPIWPRARRSSRRRSPISSMRTKISS